MTLLKATSPILIMIPLFSLLAGCGDNRSNPFSKCGNGICDSGEECDDGAVTEGSPDEDQCLSTCQYNRCGDGFINANPPTTGQRCVLPLPEDVLQIEECDPFSFQPVECSTFGLSGGEARCMDDCRADTSDCGPPFTPTPTSTPTPTTTSTPTVTPTFTLEPTITPGGPTFTPTPTPTDTPTITPTRSEGCGNGTVEDPESCDDGGVCMGGSNQGARCITIGASGQCPSGTNAGNSCSANEDCPESFCPADCDDGICVTGENDECPAECLIDECEPAETIQAFGVVLTVPFGETATSVTFFVNYPEGQVSIPGVGLNPQTRSRIFTGTCDSEGQEFCETTSQCPEGFTCDRPSGTLIASDFDHAIRIVVDRSAPIEPGPVLALLFDDCSGAEPPSPTSFSCSIQGCSGPFGIIDGCECSIEER